MSVLEEIEVLGPIIESSGSSKEFTKITYLSKFMREGKKFRSGSLQEKMFLELRKKFNPVGISFNDEFDRQKSKFDKFLALASRVFFVSRSGLDPLVWGLRRLHFSTGEYHYSLIKSGKVGVHNGRYVEEVEWGIQQHPNRGEIFFVEWTGESTSVPPFKVCFTLDPSTWEFIEVTFGEHRHLTYSLIQEQLLKFNIPCTIDTEGKN